MNDIVIKAGFADGFTSFEDGVEGDADRPGGGLIQGGLIKFSNEATWTRDGDELPAMELIVADLLRVVQKWKDGAPIETQILEPGQKFPDLEKLNATVPQNEWGEGPDGKARGPWQSQHIVYLIDEKSMDRYTWPTGTTGGSIAVRDLVDRTKFMRRFRGANVYPVVTLSDVYMNTRFGGRQRPHFVIKRWISLGGEAPPALGAPGAAEPGSGGKSDGGAKAIAPVTAKEATGDEVIY